MTKARFEALRKFSCVECDRQPVDIAHSNFSEHGKDKGIKADDRYTISLCRDCHQKFDTYGLGMDGQQSMVFKDA